MTNETFPSDEQVIETYIPWTCTDGQKNHYRKKIEPICKPEERKNCVQVWETNANGEKVLP